MAVSNRERVSRVLDLLRDELREYVCQELKAVHKDSWGEIARQCLSVGKPAGKGASINWDTQSLLSVMIGQWEGVFKKKLGTAERSLVSELKDVRNRWAHEEAFTADDTYRALDTAQRLLLAISSPKAEDLEKSKHELLRARFDEQARKEQKKAAVASIEGQPAGGLTPWRQVVTPHPDVASGRFRQAEFAANLAQVYKNEGSDEYRKPQDFFQRTFLTDGLRHMLVNALRRLSDVGGDPVVELQTNFGGGKTHSMLALYHLFSGVPAAELPGVEPVLNEAGVSQVPAVRRAVFVGQGFQAGQTHVKDDGTVVHTMWGEIAWQLLGKEGYKLLADSDRNGTNPGEALGAVFKQAAPCLILIDEWVAFVRQLYGTYGLPAGSFEANFTFAQALTEYAATTPGVLVVASLPASDIEIGGEGGREALARLKNVFSRVESAWRPASAEEGFEIVRRRLFQPIPDPKLFAARDAVVRAFSDLYRTQAAEFPSDCKELAYEKRLAAAYPIHPELFDRLYTDWSSLEKFQRTRGVLRLMAAVIHALWEQQDASLLIMPANVPVSESAVQFELTRYLDDPWVPVIEKDVDGPNSLPLSIDRDTPNLGRYSACRRVSRTLYLGSAPTLTSSRRGLEDRRIKLGCTQPGESVATFGDALRRLTDDATYLYEDNKRYWYATQPSVTKLADERAARFSADDVAEELRRRLREAAKDRADFSKVVPCPTGGEGVEDRNVRDTRLVILGPEHPHANRDAASPARRFAAEVLDQHGTGPRLNKNTLVFLAPDRSRLVDLEQGVRKFLAWKSIDDQAKTLNLDEFQKNQAKTKQQAADQTVDARIPETYQWLLVPGQADPKSAVEWQEMRLQGQDGLAARAAKRLKNDMLLITKYGPTLLADQLNGVPLWRGDHVSVKQLTDDFAQYLYLPRLRGPDVLADSASEGLAILTWQTDTFAYAEDWDAAKGRYRGLTTGQRKTLSADGGGLLVRPDVAAKQVTAEAKPDPAPEPTGPTGTGGSKPGPTGGGPTGGTGGEGKPPAKTLRRFHGTVALDPTRLTSSAGKIADEVIQHLNGLVGADVEVILDIQVQIPGGAPEHVVRTVTENCRTLKFRSHGFEES